MLSPLPNRFANHAACAALALTALLLSGCGGNSNSCVISGDCSNGLLCQSGACVGANQCAAGVLSCTDTSQCGPAKICQTGCCTAVSGCATSADCTNPALPHCNPVKNVCETCATNAQCTGGRLCTPDGHCESGCATNADCKTASKPVCAAGGFCGPATTLAGFAAGASTVLINGTATLTATLSTNAAAATDVAVSVVSGGGTLAASKITIAAGSNSGSVVYTAPATAGTATIDASLGGIDKTVDLIISGSALALDSLTPATLFVQAGATGTLTATLNAQATTSTSVSLSSDALGAATVPSGVTVAQGSATAAVTVTGVAASATAANIKASLNGDKSAAVTVFALGLTSLTPASATAAASSTVKTTLVVIPPPGPATVHVSVDVGTINGGGTSADLPIDANATSTSFNVGMPASGTVNVTAAANGNTKSASIAVSTATAALTVMVIRVDGGGAALAGASSAVTLEEHKFTTDAALRSIALPIAVAATGNTALTLTGNSGTEGGLSRSGDGKYVLLAGYGIAPGATSPNQTASSVTPRVIGRVDNAGNVDTTTRITTLFSGTAAASSAIRGATSTNGTDLWATGSTSGVVYTTLGSSTAIALNTVSPTNNRHVHVFGGQLYVSSTTGAFQGVSTVGTGAPTSGSPAITLLAGFPTASAATISLGSFGLLDLDATPGPEVAYVAQEVVPTTADVLNLEKWTLSGASWTKSAAFAPKFPAGGGAGGVIGLAAFLDGASVRIVATTFESSSATPNRLVTLIDDGSANPAVSVLATAPANSAFRGVALSPTP